MTWRIEVTLAAERDFDGILEWTRSTFGPRQAVRYEQALLDLIAVAAVGPQHHAFRARPALGVDVYTVHMRDCGLKGRHLMLVRVLDPQSRQLALMRILHDRMDLTRA